MTDMSKIFANNITYIVGSSFTKIIFFNKSKIRFKPLV